LLCQGVQNFEPEPALLLRALETVSLRALSILVLRRLLKAVAHVTSSFGAVNLLVADELPTSTAKRYLLSLYRAAAPAGNNAALKLASVTRLKPN
jgi:hypothetical protein